MRTVTFTLQLDTSDAPLDQASASALINDLIDTINETAYVSDIKEN